ncbi:hypothetical protein EG349_00970 [Chryseobacterium shandongense]|uniref:Uncharacterized protein n=1 Tax=Chryseobacterium shandongense TaxID=1493872 RepID=A0AAD1DL17_9FLAO|nr:hypothetical protein [Chryseobacterium shandongense]AZA85460.1 hypothetical protein EG349_00970 [Chryseobacterium shandongense]AZA97567.1 hypothetical protein EG353_19440 [Chryseobacterium shandongense]
MKISLCYLNGSVDIEWNIPFFPRTGEYISTAEILSEKEAKQLAENRDYFKIINISWFPSLDSKEPYAEIILE